MFMFCRVSVKRVGPRQVLYATVHGGDEQSTPLGRRTPTFSFQTVYRNPMVDERAQRQRSIDAFYSRWAPVSDVLARHALFIGRSRRRTIAALELAPGDRVVELGVGTGANLPVLRERIGPDGRMVGIDIAVGALERARADASDDAAGTLQLVRGDVTAPPFCRADAVLATFVVGLLEDPADAITAWLDGMVPGGRIALLHATARGRPLLAPLDAAFRAFVRLAAAGGPADRSTAAVHESRVRRAEETVASRCVDVRRESLLGGYLTLVSGRKPDPPK